MVATKNFRKEQSNYQFCPFIAKNGHSIPPTAD